jgi:hypothetical protein
MAAPAKPAQSLLPGSSTSRVSYQHTWWQDATFNKPAAASPLFSYTFRRAACLLAIKRRPKEIMDAVTRP